MNQTNATSLLLYGLKIFFNGYIKRLQCCRFCFLLPFQKLGAVLGIAPVFARKRLVTVYDWKLEVKEPSSHGIHVRRHGASSMFH